MQITSINKLPEEVLVQVFKYLSFKELEQNRQVCGLWKRILKDISLWEIACSGTQMYSSQVRDIRNRCVMHFSKKWTGRYCFRISGINSMIRLNENQFVTGTYSGQVYVWDTDFKENFVFEFKDLNGVRALSQLTSDILIVGTDCGTLAFLDLKNKKNLATFSIGHILNQILSITHCNSESEGSFGKLRVAVATQSDLFYFIYDPSAEGMFNDRVTLDKKKSEYTFETALDKQISAFGNKDGVVIIGEKTIEHPMKTKTAVRYIKKLSSGVIAIGYNNGSLQFLFLDGTSSFCKESDKTKRSPVCNISELSDGKVVIRRLKRGVGLDTANVLECQIRNGVINNYQDSMQNGLSSVIDFQGMRLEATSVALRALMPTYKVSPEERNEKIVRQIALPSQRTQTNLKTEKSFYQQKWFLVALTVISMLSLIFLWKWRVRVMNLVLRRNIIKPNRVAKLLHPNQL